MIVVQPRSSGCRGGTAEGGADSAFGAAADARGLRGGVAGGGGPVALSSTDESELRHNKAMSHN